MLVLEQNQDGMVLVRRRPAKPSVIAGVLFGALATVPMLSGAELSGPRLVTTLAMATVAGALIWLGRASDIRYALPSGLGKSRLPAPARIELSGGESYQARLLRSDGSSALLFERSEPTGVVRDVLELSARFSLPVRPGWGLDDVAWAVLSEPPGTSRADARLEPPVVAESWPLVRQRTAAFTSLWAGVFVLVVSIVLAVSPYRSGITPSFLSVVLPALAVVHALVVGAWLVGLRERLTLGSRRIECARLWFGRPLGRALTIDTTVNGVFSVGPTNTAVRHVLLATANGPLAFAVDPVVAEKLAFATHEIGPAAGRAAE
jgi:hypothetical protein